MMPSHFDAFVIDSGPDRPECARRRVPTAGLPEGEVTIAVSHSALNYKDALAVTGRGKIARRYPMIPGVDLAGTVVASTSADFPRGKAVFATGFGLGERDWGGLAELARVPATKLLPIPEGWSAEAMMAFGTAGFTAMLAVKALEESGALATEREVVVTGAGGAVGAYAISLLAAKGVRVAAATGRAELEPHLRGLGAKRCIPRAELDRDSQPLEKETWAGGIDVVGGRTLATLLASTARNGTIAACGLAGGADLPTSVHPFILRGVRLQGIDSVYVPLEKRATIWRELLALFPRDKLAELYRVISMSEVEPTSHKLLAGRIRGRIVVRIGTTENIVAPTDA